MQVLVIVVILLNIYKITNAKTNVIKVTLNNNLLEFVRNVLRAVLLVQAWLIAKLVLQTDI